ncbi:MAG: peptidoglycan-binding protein, partial [Desulfobacterales bacterium CG23_combo_of_CG06-09_8_20_14_all_51_8]
FGEGKILEAIQLYNKAINLTPDYHLPYYNRGNAYAELGQLQLAIEDFNKTISLQPDVAEAYFNRGNIYLYQGKRNLGCSDAQKACVLGKCKLLEAAKAKGFCR